MNKDKLTSELDSVYSELITLSDAANELHHFAAKLSKCVYEVNKRIDNLELPKKLSQKKEK